MPDERHPQPVNAPVQKTIAAKLRKLFSNKAQTIAPAIGEEGGSSGGVSPVIVTLDLQNNTWSGATWAELHAAYLRNAAGMQLPKPSGGYDTFWATEEGFYAIDIVDHPALLHIGPGSTIFIVETGLVAIETPEMGSGIAVETP